MLEIVDLQKSYGEQKALAGINLSVAPEETVVIIGPSGCGKSTLLRCINRLIEPDGGEVFFDARPMGSMSDTELRAVRRQIGFVFQHFQLIQRLSVLENVLLGLVMSGMAEEEARAAAIDALDQVQLRSLQHRYPTSLSGGQQQRVAIARALALQPRFMLWDEPTAALDPILVAEVLDVMEQLAARRNTGMLVVTHEVRFAKKAADRVVVLDEGVIVEEGSPEQVFSAPRSRVARQYARLLGA